MNRHSLKSVLFSLLLLTLAASLVSGALADVRFRTDGDLQESEKGGSVNCNTTDILVPGMDIEFSSDFVGETDAYDIVQGYSVYINGQLYNYYAQKILDCRVPFQVWHSTMIDEKMVYANVVVKTKVGNAYYDYDLTVKEDEVRPLCAEHVMEFNLPGIKNAVYTKCEKTPGKYYLSSCMGNYRCVVCGMETAWTVFKFSEDNSPSIVDRPDGSQADSILEDMPVDTALANQLRTKAHSLVSDVYTDMAEENENNIMEDPAEFQDVGDNFVAEDISSTEIEFSGIIRENGMLTVQWSGNSEANHYRFAARYLDETDQLINAQNLMVNKISIADPDDAKDLQIWVGVYNRNDTLVGQVKRVLQGGKQAEAGDEQANQVENVEGSKDTNDVPHTEVAEKEVVPEKAYHSAMTDYDDMYTLFDSAVDDVMDRQDNLVYRHAKAFYKGADIISTTIDLLTSNEEKKLTDMAKDLLRENYTLYIAQEYASSWDQLTDWFNNASLGYDALMTIDTLDGVYNNPSILHGFSDKFGDTGFTLFVNGIEIFFDSMEDVQGMLALLMDHNRSVSYLENIKKYTIKNTVLYQAADELLNEINSNDPFQEIEQEVINNMGMKALRFVADGSFEALMKSEELIQASTAVTTKSSFHIIRRNFWSREFKYIKNLNFQAALHGAAETLWAWEAGATIGNLITYGTGKMVEAEDDLMRISFINSEIDMARRRTGDDDIASLDLNSLYLTTQEAGVTKACAYYKYYGMTWKESLKRLFGNTDYPSTDEFKHMEYKQRLKINSIRTKMNLPESELYSREDAEEALDDLFELFNQPGAGDSDIY